ncbi:hypothetical protein F5Y04DRAFT_84638 [Hypomontagnella monticulosa]|nr:hypothetical protein F5Y04DRAFT_84638 [Hypomontagnella monticulosa]
MGDWFGHDVSPPSTAWKFQFVVVLPLLGTSICSAHLQAIRFSKLSLLPRLLPSSSHFGTTYNFTSSVVKMCGAPTPRIQYEAPAWLHELIPFDKLPPWGFQEWDLKSNIEAIERPIPLRLRLSSTRLLTLLSFAMTLGLIVYSLVKHDAVGCIALVSLALSTSCSSMAIFNGPIILPFSPGSSVIHKGLKYRVTEPKSLPKTTITYTAPDPTIHASNSIKRKNGIVTLTRNEAFVVMHCSPLLDVFIFLTMDIETLSRESRLTPWHILATLLYLCGLVLLSISRWETQVATGAFYLITLGLYTTFNPGYLKPEIEIQARQHFSVGCDDAHKFKPDLRGRERYPSFARTLWYAIRATRETEWVLRNEVVPGTPQWREWLDEAKRNVDNKDWPAVSELERIMLNDDGSKVYGRPPKERETNERQEPSTQDEITPIPVENW